MSAKKISFNIEANLNRFIFELKEIIQKQIGYRCDEQRLVLFSYEYRSLYKKLKDGNKVGDYLTIKNDTRYICSSMLIVEKREINKNILFNSIPDVTDYEYAMMSSHVYKPNESFLNDWHIIQHNPPNKNGLALAIYIHLKRHQCVIAIRGTDLTSSILGNLITGLRLLLSNQTIDTFDAARLLVFHEEPINIPSEDSISYVISFTGHSLGAALAENFACVYHGYAVTFDSPGTSTVLNNDLACLTNIEFGYNPKAYIRTYLGAYANLINVVRPQFGQVTYLKQFGISSNTGPAKIFYIYSSAGSVYLAACIVANIIEKKLFKLSVWLTMGYLIKKSSTVYWISNLFDLDLKMLSIFDWYAKQFPVTLTSFLLCQSISTLATVIERTFILLIQKLDRIAPIKRQKLNAIIVTINPYIDFNSVVCRYVILSIHLTASFCIVIGVPALCYWWWLKSAHSIDKFVESFNPINGNPYEGQTIESTLWPTLFDHLTKTSSSQFLLFLLIIQSMKLGAYYLLPPCIPKRLRLNIILVLFAVFFNIDSMEHLIFMFILLLFIVIPVSQHENEHYIRNVICATAGLLAITQMFNERHGMNKFYCEVVGCPMMLFPFVKRLWLI